MIQDGDEKVTVGCAIASVSKARIEAIHGVVGDIDWHARGVKERLYSSMVALGDFR